MERNEIIETMKDYVLIDKREYEFSLIARNNLIELLNVIFTYTRLSYNKDYLVIDNKDNILEYLKNTNLTRYNERLKELKDLEGDSDEK